MPRVRFRVRPIYDQLADFSAEHPDDEFRILTSHHTDEGLITILEAETSDPDSIVRYFADAPQVRSQEVLHADEQVVLIRYAIAEPPPHRMARSMGVPPSGPLVLRNGWMTIEVVTSQERLSRFKDGLEAADVTHEIISISQSLDPSALLTDRQRQFVTEAAERGYYDSPRRCSLTDLAVTMDVSKATASGILHRAEERIVKEFLGEPS